MRKRYVAYGSNLNLKQMEYRCQSAKLYGKGILRGYRLLFKGSEDNAYLTIEPCKGSKIPVVIWDIGPGDEMHLDVYESFPTFYYKEDVEVELDTGETISGMVYIMTSKIKDRIKLSLPSDKYYAAVMDGYKDHGFDPKYIQEAIEVSVKGGDF